MAHLHFHVPRQTTGRMDSQSQNKDQAESVKDTLPHRRKDGDRTSSTTPRIRGSFAGRGLHPRPFDEVKPKKWTPDDTDTYRPQSIVPPVHPIAQIFRSGHVYKKVHWYPENETWIQKSFWIYIATALGITFTIAIAAVACTLVAFTAVATLLGSIA